MGYRLTKFFCKNRTAVITASCVALSLVGGIIGTSLAMLRAQQAESLANSRLVELRQAYERESEQRTRSQREQIRLLIESLLRAKGDDFSVVLNALQSCDKSMVLAELNPRFEAAQVPEIKVPLAFALATFGVVQLDYLISSIDEQSESDHAKLIVALQASPERALASIHSAARQCTTSGTWRRKSKLAMVSLAIGDLQLFAEVAEYRQIPNHDLRSTLIDEFPRWPLDLKRLCDSVRQCDSPPLRSAVCLGIGSLPLDGLGERDRNAVVGLANGWYQTLDSATHSAAAWLLRRLNCQPPDVDSSTRIVDGRDWYKNSQGATMILVRPESVSTIQLPDPRDRHYKIISETKENQTNGILKNADLLRRGAAYYHTEQFELAARDLELYISAIRKKEVNDTYSPESQFQYAYQMHTITLAKLNRRFEADKAYEQMRNFLATNISYAETEASTVIREKLKSDREESNRQLLEYMDIVMALFFGDTDIARQRLADTVEAASKSSDQTYILRAAFAICQYINHLHLQGSERQDYVDKALYLLERWESVTYVSPRNILLDAPAWMALYELDRFKSIVLSVPKVPYWIAACEVSRREFEDFLQDSNYAGEKPNAEDVAHAVHASLKERFSPTPQHPVTTRLEGAILFCNWLSSREGLQKVYRVGGKQSVYNFQLGKKVDVNDWEADSSADGYQLPPLINWEHACRAGCMDDYSTGGQEQFLKLVAQIDSEASGACGEKMPNELGIHDMHGNFEELCSKGSKQYLLKGGNFMFSPARATWGDRVRYFNRQELTLEPVGIRLFRNISPAKR